MEPSSTVLVFVCFALALLAIFGPGLWADLRAAVAAIRAGAQPDRRSPRGGYAALPVRQSPGHRNFGIPPQPRGSLTDVLEGQHPGLTGVARHVLGDH